MTVLKPIQKNLPELKIIKKRVSLKENESTHFEMQMDLKTMQNTFKNLCANLPSYLGNLIIFASTNSQKIILDIIHSTNELRNDFKANKNTITRWCRDLEHHTTNNFNSLSFQIAKELLKKYQLCI